MVPQEVSFFPVGLARLRCMASTGIFCWKNGPRRTKAGRPGRQETPAEEKKDRGCEKPLTKSEKQKQRRAQLAEVGSLVEASMGPAARQRYSEYWARLIRSTGQVEPAYRNSAAEVDELLCQVLQEMFL